MSASILVVDDDASIRSLVVTLLRREGLTADQATGGRDAVKHDVVLLDLMMSDGTGYAGIVGGTASERSVRHRNDGSLDANHRNIALPNIHATLRKPFDIAELMQAVRSIAHISSENADGRADPQ